MITKNCDLCGDEFHTNLKRKLYCVTPHPFNCSYCGDSMEIKKPQRGRKLYPCIKQECRSEAVRQTNLARYGVENVAQVESVKKSIRDTNLMKYGTEHAFQSDKVKDKIKKTNIERYGTETPRWHNEKSREKAEKTNIERYGHENPFGSKEIQDKIVKGNIEKYGVSWSTQAEEVKSKMKKSFIERYGVDNPAKLQKFKDKAKLTNIERYGSDSHMKSEEGILAYEEGVFKRFGVYNVSHIGITNYKDYINIENFLASTEMSITDLAEYFNLPRRRIRKRIIELNLQDKFDDLYVRSVSEEMFVNFLKNDSNLKDIKYLRNDRKILEGKELDFYFPENKLAIEVSPTYTHNSKVGWGGKGDGVSSTYHINKFLMCQEKGIELLTVFDWHDWDKVLQMIKIKLQGSTKRVYARKTSYLESPEITEDLFSKISSWHILSLPTNIKRESTVSILKDDEDIVGLALWGDIKNGLVELKRMVFKPGVSVPGGASKLIKNFYSSRDDIDEIYTFSDCDLGSGAVYGKVGFELIEESKPVLTYYNEKYDKHVKHLSLVRQGADRLLKNLPNYIPVGMGENLPSNREIVESYGFLPVYDCGYRKWILNIK